jgi:hypothetical protein
MNKLTPSSLVNFSKASLAMDGSLSCCAQRSTAWKWPVFRLPRLTFAVRWPRLSWTFKLMTGCAAMTTLLMLFAVQRLPYEERIVVEKPNIVMQVDSGALQESVREPDPVVEPVIRIIQTTRIAATSTAEPTPKHPDIELLPPASMPPVVLVQKEDDRPSRHGRRHGGDVCSRHGLRRVETRSGRSWHCR